MDKENKVVLVSSLYVQCLVRIIEGFVNEDGLSLSFKVYLIEDVNVWVMVNGCVCVYLGLMDMVLDDEVCGVIGYEIGYVKLGYSKFRMWIVMLVLVGCDMFVVLGNVNIVQFIQGQFGELVEGFVNVQFLQKEESVVDEYGYCFMKWYSYDLVVLVSMFCKLFSQGGLMFLYLGLEVCVGCIDVMIKKDGKC